MAWTAPITFVGNMTFTAAQINAYLTENMKITAPALATTESSYFVATGANAIAERIPDSSRVDTSETRTSTTYGALATVGPAVTCVTGTQALVFIMGRLDNNTDNAFSKMSYAISGATTVAAADDWCIQREGLSLNNPVQMSEVNLHTGLTAGTNTFTCQYNAGGVSTGTFANRFILVMPL